MKIKSDICRGCEYFNPDGWGTKRRAVCWINHLYFKRGEGEDEIVRTECPRWLEYLVLTQGVGDEANK